jgi:hypothetical protein
MLLFKRRNKEVGDDEAAQRQSSDKTFITPSFGKYIGGNETGYYVHNDILRFGRW